MYNQMADNTDMNRPSRYKPRSFADTLVAYCRNAGGDLWNYSKSAPAQSALSRLTGIAQPNFTRWLSGTATPDSAKVQILARRLGLTTDQMLGLESIPGIDTEDGIQEPSAIYTIATKLQQVPIINSVQAGNWRDSEDIYQPGQCDEWIACPVTHSKFTFALRVQGDSMVSPHGTERSYPPGCIIFVDPERVAENGSKVVVRLPNSNDTTFKVLAIDSGNRYLRPINPQFPVIQITDEAVICGVVIGSFIPE